MINILRKLFGLGPRTNFAELLQQGGQIIDVRTKSEFASGHIKDSLNIPLDSLQKNTGKIKKNKPVILCCASGMRSGTAKSILKSKGFTEVYNGGGWLSLESRIRQN